MKHKIPAILILMITLLIPPADLFSQRIYTFEQFLKNVRIKREKDLDSLGCHSFTVLQEQIIREDTTTTRLTLRGREYHSKNQPLVRVYEGFWYNDNAVSAIPDPDTLLLERKPPAFYDENFHTYYMIKDLGTTGLNGEKMRHLEFIPRSRQSGLMKGRAWIDPNTFGIIKMTLEPYPLPDGITKMIIEIFNTYNEKGRIIRYGMQSLNHIITVDKQLEIRIRERYSDYRYHSDSLCDSLNTHFSLPQ